MGHAGSTDSCGVFLFWIFFPLYKGGGGKGGKSVKENNMIHKNKNESQEVLHCGLSLWVIKS